MHTMGWAYAHQTIRYSTVYRTMTSECSLSSSDSRIAGVPNCFLSAWFPVRVYDCNCSSRIQNASILCKRGLVSFIVCQGRARHGPETWWCISTRKFCKHNQYGNDASQLTLFFVWNLGFTSIFFNKLAFISSNPHFKVNFYIISYLLFNLI